MPGYFEGPLFQKLNFIVHQNPLDMKLLFTLQNLKAIYFPALALFLFNACGSPGGSGLTEQDKEFLQAIHPAIANAWNAGDRQPYLDRFTDNALYMVPNLELVEGKEAIKAFVMSFPDFALEYSVVEIWGSGNIAIIRGKYVGKDTQGNVTDQGKFLNLFKKNSEGKWVSTHDIWNSDLPAASGNTGTDD